MPTGPSHGSYRLITMLFQGGHETLPETTIISKIITGLILQVIITMEGQNGETGGRYIAPQIPAGGIHTCQEEIQS